MREIRQTLLLFFIIVLFISCNRKVENEKEQIMQEPIVKTVSAAPAVITVEQAPFSYLDGDNFDWMTEYGWLLLDGRRYEDLSVEAIDWIGMTPRVKFRKFDIPTNSILYQERLRKNRFTLMYQTKEAGKLNIVENSRNTSVLSFEFIDNYSRIRRYIDSISMGGGSNRVGQQENLDYPLVGIWGNLPSLNEYRIVDPLDSLYTMEIIEAGINWGIPDFAVRVGTYLLRQTSENTFETVSAFPDGLLRLEILNDRHFLLRPLFELPDEEEGLVALLQMHRDWVKLDEMPGEDLNPFR